MKIKIFIFAKMPKNENINYYICKSEFLLWILKTLKQGNILSK